MRLRGGIIKNNLTNQTSNDIVLYTPKEIQKIFKCGRNQAYEIIHSNGFPKIQIGRKILIPKNKLEKWIDGNIGKTIIT